MSLKDISPAKWRRFALWGALYLAWVVWLGNYWFLLGLPVIFDGLVTHKVHWRFWRKRGAVKQGAVREWIDAIIFAVVVVTFINMFFFQAFKIPSSSMESTLYTGDHLFVSKLAYGPKVPQTPLTIPFTHNVLPSGKKSYSTLIQNPYRRLKGWGKVQREDIVVFCFPDGDTVLTQMPAADYYAVVRATSKDYAIKRWGPLMVHPKDKKDHYVKRCVALPGDTLLLQDARLFINGAESPLPENAQHCYTVVTQGGKLHRKTLDRLDVNLSELYYDPSLPGYRHLALSRKKLELLQEQPEVVSVQAEIERVEDGPDAEIFPFQVERGWTRDNMGPLWVPEKGATVTLTSENLPLYRRIITSYEDHKLEEKDGAIYIDDKQVSTYTFEMDYYFMMGDNRHNSLDSRYWGFVPEDHIVGKPRVIWLSTDSNRSFPKNIRWGRFLKFL
ncbi:MAG: signal peptidase I [Bacteroidales bacterium]|nr:signal peptidase I [Bacteroidales bacterium]